jgi:hypothetical protein
MFGAEHTNSPHVLTRGDIDVSLTISNDGKVTVISSQECKGCPLDFTLYGYEGPGCARTLMISTPRQEFPRHFNFILISISVSDFSCETLFRMYLIQSERRKIDLF